MIDSSLLTVAMVMLPESFFLSKDLGHAVLLDDFAQFLNHFFLLARCGLVVGGLWRIGRAFGFSLVHQLQLVFVIGLG